MNRIRELRKQIALTQNELAKHLQISDSTLSYWEMGKYEPDNDALIKLSRFFQVPIDYILGGDFLKWDIDVIKMPYPEFDASCISGSDISISESTTTYNNNSNSEVSVGLSAQDTQKPGSQSETASGFKSVTADFDRIEFRGLSQDEVDTLAEYALFIKSRRNKQRQN